MTEMTARCRTRSRYVQRGRGSDFRCLGKRKRIIEINAEVSNGIFDLGVPKQDLNNSKIAGSLVDQGCLGTAERMCSVFASAANDSDIQVLGREGRGVEQNIRNPYAALSRLQSSRYIRRDRMDLRRRRLIF